MANMVQHRPPVIVGRQAGEGGDALDLLSFEGHDENPAYYEEVLETMFRESETDPDLAATLKRLYVEKDRKAAFENCIRSGAMQAMAGLLAALGVGKDAKICDYGCGIGHLGWGLQHLGFSRMSWMDPNDNYYSGTGSLADISGGKADIVNSFDGWAKRSNEFDVIVSKGTIHHWNHIPQGAICLRRALKPGGLWLAASEFFARSPSHLAKALNGHPFYNKYMTYEWAYPASVYVDMIESAGFELYAVIPQGYANNAYLYDSFEAAEDLDVEALTKEVDENLTDPGGTVEKFWDEVDRFRRPRPGRRVYSVPQVMVFRRIGLE